MKDLQRFFQEHRTTSLSVGITVLGAVLFTLLFVQPSAVRVSRLQNEIATLKKTVEQVVPGGSGGRAFEEIVLEKQKELKKLEGGLPQKERISEILKNLSQRATEIGVTVLSIRPQVSQPYPSAETPLRLEGQVCHALPVQMQLECPYRTLGKYLESLTENFPSVVTVDNLEIRREEGKLPALKISLVITSYVFQSE